jgi:hypothetical protein
MTTTAPSTQTFARPRAGMVAVCALLGLGIVQQAGQMIAFRAFAARFGEDGISTAFKISSALTIAICGLAVLCLLLRPQLLSLLLGIVAAWMLAMGRQLVAAVLAMWLGAGHFIIGGFGWILIVLAALITAYLVASAISGEFTGLSLVPAATAARQRLLAVNDAMGHRSVDEKSQLEDIFE